MIETRMEVKIPEIYSNGHSTWIENNVIALVHTNQFVYKNKIVVFINELNLDN